MGAHFYFITEELPGGEAAGLRGRSEVSEGQEALACVRAHTHTHTHTHPTNTQVHGRVSEAAAYSVRCLPTSRLCLTLLL